MSILTNFLKLVKPEKNDYVDVEEHISNNLDKIDEKMENFNLNKLDKGGYTGTAQNLLTEISKIASKTVLGRIIVGKGLTVDSSGRTSVVSKNDGIIVNDNDIQLNVYDGVDSSSTTRAGSARAIKMAYDKANAAIPKTDIANDLTTGGTDKVLSGQMGKELKKQVDEKLGKGTYNGDAQDLKNDIDGKISKNGDIINGQLVFDLGIISTDQILAKKDGVVIFGVGYADGSKGAFFSNVRGNSRIWLYDSGITKIDAKNLNTQTKEVVGAINEIYSSKLINVDNVQWKEVKTYQLQKAINPNYKFIYIWGTQFNKRQQTMIRIPTEYYQEYNSISSHDEYCEFRFKDYSTFEITSKLSESTEQNIIFRIEQRNI